MITMPRHFDYSLSIYFILIIATSLSITDCRLYASLLCHMLMLIATLQISRCSLDAALMMLAFDATMIFAVC